MGAQNVIVYMVIIAVLPIVISLGFGFFYERRRQKKRSVAVDKLVGRIKCPVCGWNELVKVKASGYVHYTNVRDGEKSRPLALLKCKRCGHVMFFTEP